MIAMIWAGRASSFARHVARDRLGSSVVESIYESAPGWTPPATISRDQSIVETSRNNQSDPDPADSS